MAQRALQLAVVGLALLGAVYGWASYRDAQQAQRDESARIAADIQAERDAQDAIAEADRARRKAAEAEEEAAKVAALRSERSDLEATMVNVRDIDKLLVLDWAGRDIGSTKRTDVTRGRPYRVDVYQEGGRITATHASVDLDRDELWDEKWVFEPDGSIRRSRSPNDDENFTVYELWTGTTFKREGT